jgi:hypothetical protein
MDKSLFEEPLHYATGIAKYQAGRRWAAAAHEVLNRFLLLRCGERGLSGRL